MTFDPIILLLLGLLIGLLVGLILIGVWSARAHPRNWDWLAAHDRVMGGLLMLAVFALGVFVTYVLLR
jgi:hypothetical protein